MKKRFALAVIVTTAIALSLVGCGVKVTNISVPDAAILEKGESITLPVNFGTEDAPAGTSDMLAIERSSSDPVDKWIHELSDEELEELVNFSENDIFLN